MADQASTPPEDNAAPPEPATQLPAVAVAVGDNAGSEGKPSASPGANAGLDKNRDLDQDLAARAAALRSQRDKELGLEAEGLREDAPAKNKVEPKEERFRAFERRRISLCRVQGSELARVRNTFVAPTGYVEFIDRVFVSGCEPRQLLSSDKRIWLIAGRRRSGLSATAIRLAIELMEIDQAVAAWYYEDSDLSLQDVVAEANLPENSVLIFDDVFQHGRMRTESLLRYEGSVNAELRRRKLWFIFTLPEPSEEFASNKLIGAFPCLLTGQPHIPAVFIRLVETEYPEADCPEWHGRLKQLLCDHQAAFAEPTTAADIDYWFRMHRDNPAELARWIATRGYEQVTRVQDWFDRLPNLNYKLYALLVALLRGPNARLVDDLYQRAVVRLRQDGMGGPELFIDPRSISTQTLDVALRLRRRSGYVDFADGRYAGEAKHQIGNYPKLLMPIVEDFLTIMQMLGAAYRSEHRRQKMLGRLSDGETAGHTTQLREQVKERIGELLNARELVASALVQISLPDLEQLRQYLDAFARDDELYVVMAARDALAYLVQHTEHCGYVLEILEEWSQSKDFVLMWACAAAISRVYTPIAEQADLAANVQPGSALATSSQPMDAKESLAKLRGQLTRLAASCGPDVDWRDELRLAVVNAMAYIAVRQPGEMADLAEQWLKGNRRGDPVWQAGRLALNRLFVSVNTPMPGVLEQRAVPLLRLLPAAFRARGRFAADGQATADQHQNRNLVKLRASDPLRTALFAVFGWAHIAQQSDGSAELSDQGDPVSELALSHAAEWEKLVLPKLLSTLAEVTQRQRAAIRKVLLEVCLRPKYAQSRHIHRLVMLLVSRSLVLDGTVMDLPQTERAAVIIADPAATPVQRRSLFCALQELAALTPLQIMRLGDARWRCMLGTVDEGALSPEGQSIGAVIQALDPARHSHIRPPLLMPLLQPCVSTQQLPVAPDQTPYLAIYTTTHPPDIADLADDLPVPPARRPLPDNPFVRTQPVSTAPAPDSWPWSGKVYLLGTDAGAIPEPLRERVTVLAADADGAFLLTCKRQLAKFLHKAVGPSRMWDELEARGLPAARSGTALQTMLTDLLPRINANQPEHPRGDAAVTLAWSFLALARTDCEQAVTLVEAMLRSELTGDAGLMQRRLGAALVRMLFNFHAATPAALSVQQHAPLLRLMAAFSNAAVDASDVIPVWEVLLKWAALPGWWPLFCGEHHQDDSAWRESKLYPWVAGLKQSNAESLLRWLEKYDSAEEHRRTRDLALELGWCLRRLVAGAAPTAPGEHGYGLVVFAGVDKELVRKSCAFARWYAAARPPEGVPEQVMLVFHHLGSDEIVGTVQGSAEASTIDLRAGRRRMHLLGPVLQRYNAAQVTFIALFSDEVILDYDDWTELKDWADRLTAGQALLAQMAGTIPPRVTP